MMSLQEINDLQKSTGYRIRGTAAETALIWFGAVDECVRKKFGVSEFQRKCDKQDFAMYVLDQMALKGLTIEDLQEAREFRDVRDAV